MYRDYSEVNLGCRRRIISGISWVFSQVEKAILLEDDCLPSQSFFVFASEMLERYQENTDIMMISGSNGVAPYQKYDHSYTFARSVGIWGWATWARAWQYYDEHLVQWPQQRETNWLLQVLEDPEQAAFWKWKFDAVYGGNTTWDYQWLYTVWSRLGLSVIPHKNLIQNIGFVGPRYTDPSPWLRRIIDLSAEELQFPLKHPHSIQANRELDRLAFQLAYAPQDIPYFQTYPLVSIGLPVYNGQDYLSDALESLLAQNYPNLEIIICDNASSDSTEDICRNFTCRDSRLKYERNSENIGASDNFRKVFSLSSGQYFMWAAHDDMWAPSYVTKCVQALQENPTAAIACTDVIFINEHSQTLSNWTQSTSKRNLHTHGLDITDAVYELISRDGWYSFYGLMPKNIVLSLINSNMHQGEFGADVLISLDLIFKGGFYRVNERLFYYRLHSNQGSSSEIKDFNHNYRKPYTELYQNLLKTIERKSLDISTKQQIKDIFIKTLGFQNPIILEFILNEHPFLGQSCINARQTDVFIKFTIVEASADSLVPNHTQEVLDQSGKTAIVAYPFQIQSTPRTASEKRCLSLIQGLQHKGYSITLFSASDPDFNQSLIDTYSINVFTYPWSTEDSQSAQESQLPWLQTSKCLKQAFADLCNTQKPDILIVSYAIWADLIPTELSNCTTIIDTIDLFSLHTQMKAQVLQYLHQCPYPFHPNTTHPELLKENFFTELDLSHDNREIELYDRYTFTIAINPIEAQLIQSKSKNTSIISLPFTFDLNEAETEAILQKVYKDLPVLAIGPNEFNYQGYLYFTQKVLPLVLEKIPHFQLRVLGDACQHLADLPGILKSGFIEDIDAIYKTAKYAICPLIGATGQQLKILEAMAAGVPVVALSNIAQSLPLQTEHNSLIAQDAQEFADAIIRLECDPDLCAKLGQSAYKTIEAYYHTNLLKQTLDLIEIGRNNQSQQNYHHHHQLSILVDGVFFQLYQTGIARVWRSLLTEWANTELGQHIVILDRGQTAPQIPGLRYRTIPPFSYQNLEGDRQLLQQICDEENADLLISTYYTTPLTTPTVFMGYDMIPEVMQSLGAPVDLNDPMWVAKHHAINHASHYITISENTAQDLQQFFPDIAPAQITVAPCGVSPTFTPPTAAEIAQFKHKYGITKPYFLTIGSGAGGYKNLMLFYQAIAQLPTRHGFDIIATGVYLQVDPQFRDLAQGMTIHTLNLSDEELRLAYGGAIALVYPSSYEGFGMPIAEAMACGCPVITCPNASIPEVAGEAALYIFDQDIDGMAEALCEVQKPTVRNSLIPAGLEQVRQFSWATMATTVADTLIATTLAPLNLCDHTLIAFPDWTQPEAELQASLTAALRQAVHYADSLETDPETLQITLLIDIAPAPELDLDALMASAALELMLNEELEIPDGIQVTPLPSLSPLQWQHLRPRLTARILLVPEAIDLAQTHCPDLPTLTPAA